VARHADSNAWALPAWGAAHIRPAAPRCACVRPAVFGVFAVAVLGLESWRLAPELRRRLRSDHAQANCMVPVPPALHTEGKCTVEAYC